MDMLRLFKAQNFISFEVSLWYGEGVHIFKFMVISAYKIKTLI